MWRTTQISCTHFSLHIVSCLWLIRGRNRGKSSLSVRLFRVTRHFPVGINPRSELFIATEPCALCTSSNGHFTYTKTAPATELNVLLLSSNLTLNHFSKLPQRSTKTTITTRKISCHYEPTNDCLILNFLDMWPT